jgi:hypothetical protein
MFYDAITGKLSKLGESPRKILLAKRDKTYTRWVRNDENAANINSDMILDHSQDGKWLEVFVATGWEIVKEVDATAEGEAEWNAMNEEERWLFLKNYYPHLVKLAEDTEDLNRVDVEMPA